MKTIYYGIFGGYLRKLILCSNINKKFRIFNDELLIEKDKWCCCIARQRKKKVKKKQDTRWKAKVRIGINVSIICIETLFLAEYCAFGWVVGTYSWVFWFCFAIAWKFAGGRRRPSASSDPPANFQVIAKKIKISGKSANYQPNAQYQPKKCLYLYNRLQNRGSLTV